MRRQLRTHSDCAPAMCFSLRGGMRLYGGTEDAAAAAQARPSHVEPTAAAASPARTDGKRRGGRACPSTKSRLRWHNDKWQTAIPARAPGPRRRWLHLHDSGRAPPRKRSGRKDCAAAKCACV